nr:PREDICTED: arf-GAP with SH3 domain, ANK repeat and PH domain-containing protein 1-like isoform X2 [Latimeria chalumnae]|eukprot:XP_014342559.1 PREDICTED: arf-GAP with SH3 domain, ANK repeat and PH domain-containing protein 1-like isoform X2 [Latimeria chalumnae]
MPELISVSEFISETQEDYNSPTTSSFTSKMANCRNTANSIEESLDLDRSVLQKMKKDAKAKYSSGQNYIQNLENYIAAMEKLAINFQKNGDQELADAFDTFAEFSRELLTPMNSLLQNMLHNINFFLESLVKGDLKEVKGDLKKPFDKAWKDYENKFTKIEKEKRELAKQYGMVRNEVMGGEIAEELEKERRMFQLQMCEYLIKVNEIKTKKGVDLLQNFIKHYYSQCNFFQECLKTTEKLNQQIEKLAAQLYSIKQKQDEEKKQLCSLRDQLRPTLQFDQKEESLSRQSGYSMHQLQGNKQFGTERSGYLYKKSDGLRKVWQKRKCGIKNCFLTISHGTPNRPPAKLNLLTCQVKPSLEDKKCFDLISHNRTYHFLAEDELECIAWISVLTNSKEEALNMAFQQERPSGENSIEELTKSITEDIKRMPGNSVCCDCGAPDPSWVSTNLGILICIECSGTHREMGTHHSRIQSLLLDKLGTSELLLAKNVGNSGFNDIVEANLLNQSFKPTAHSDMVFRKDYIITKYVDWKFAKQSSSSPASRLKELQDAVISKDIFALIQAFAEKVDLSEPLPKSAQEPGETALHLAVVLADRTSLHIVDFLVQNSGNLEKQTMKGNTALHYCCLYNKTECLKLLLKAKASSVVRNEEGQTALDIARRMNYSLCEELIAQALKNQFNMHSHVEYEWRLRQEDMYESDDDLDEKFGPVKKERITRPYSCYQTPCTPLQANAGVFPKQAGVVPQEKRRDQYTASSTPSRSIDLQPTSQPHFAVPPVPPRNPIKAPSVPPPPPPTSVGTSESKAKQRILPPPLTHTHKRTLSEPTPSIPHSPLQHRNISLDCGSPAASKSPVTFEGSFQRSCLGSPKLPNLHVLPEMPENDFRKREETTYSIPTSARSVTCEKTITSNLNSPSPRSSISDCFEFSATQSVPLPLPRKMGTGKMKFRRVRAVYDCKADHNDELTFQEGEVIVVIGEEDIE